MEIICSIISGIIFILLVLVSIFMYPKLKIKMKGSFLADLIFIFIFATLSITNNIFILVGGYVANDSVIKYDFNFIRFCDAITQTIANFSFNSIEYGRSFYDNGLNIFIKGLEYLSLLEYYILPINLIIMLFMVVSYNFTFEFNSAIRMARPFNIFKNNIYVFSSLTEDSINLAIKIKNEYKNCMIIFYGESIPEFNKKDKLCKTVMTNGFYYKSLVENKKYGVLKSKIKNVYYFSMDIDSKLKPREEVNAKNAFNIIENSSYKNLECYILVSDKSEYNVYQRKLKKLGKEKDVIIYLLCEPDIASKILIKKMFYVATKKQKDLLEKDLNLFIVGFGELGQSILNKIYSNFIIKNIDVNTNNETKENEIDINYSNVKAKVYDLKDNIDYLYNEYKNKNAYYTVVKKEDIDIYSNNKFYDKNDKYYINDYKSFMKNTSLRDDEILDIYNPPVIEFNDNENIFKEIDDNTGITLNNNQPDIFVISTGDDLTNIRYVNYLLSDIRYEYKINKDNYNSKAQIIAINIRNDDYLYMLDINEIDKDKNQPHFIEFGGKNEKNNNIYYSEELNLYIIVFGNKDDIYSTHLLKHDDEKEFNYGYDFLYDKINNMVKDKSKELKEAIKDDSFNEGTSDFFINVIKKLNLENIDNNKKEESWKKKTISDKRSNGAVYLFKDQYKNEKFKNSLNNDNPKLAHNYLELMKLEHKRWLRDQIANGFTLGEKYKDIKYHEDMIRLIDIESNDIFYDIINVILSMKEE